MSKQHSRIALFALVAALAAGACTRFDGPRHTYFALTHFPHTVTIENRTAREICHLRLSPVVVRPEEDAWSDDILGAARRIAPGSTQRLGIEVGIWRVRAEDCRDQTVARLDSTYVDFESDAPLVMRP